MAKIIDMNGNEITKDIIIHTVILDKSCIPPAMHKIEMAINGDDKDVAKIEANIKEYCVVIGEQAVQCYRGVSPIETESEDGVQEQEQEAEITDGNVSTTSTEDKVGCSGSTKKTTETRVQREV